MQGVGWPAPHCHDSDFSHNYGGRPADKTSFLGLLYPSVAREVMDNAVTYLRISAYSYPFLAVFNSCAALFRSMGNSKISMKVSV